MAKDVKVIDQKAYLQKYLSKDKKKKKKKAIKSAGLKLIDDDIDLSKIRELDKDELDFDPRDEDAPQIAGIIDERPKELQTLETFRSSKWKVVTSNDGFNDSINVEEVQSTSKKKNKEQNDIIFGKMYSDSEDDKRNDSDLSPPRIEKDKKTNKDNKVSEKSKRSKQESPSRTKSKRITNHDSDPSPPRQKKYSNSKGNDSDMSPPRKKDRNTSRDNNISSRRTNYDSDLSPPRRYEAPKKSRTKSRWGDHEEEGAADRYKSLDSTRRKITPELSDGKAVIRDKKPTRSSSSSTNSDNSVQRKPSGKTIASNQDNRKNRYKDKNHHSYQSKSYDKKKRRRSGSESDCRESRSKESKSKNNSRRNKSKNDFSDSDQSLPRHRRKCDNDSNKLPHRNRSKETRKMERKRRNISSETDTDQSVPRHSNSNKQQSDSDQSLPRNRARHTEKTSYKRSNYPEEKRNRRSSMSDSDQSLPRDRSKKELPKADRWKNDKYEELYNKRDKTLDGKRAGLQDASALMRENEEFRRKEDEMYKRMEASVSGKDAKTVSRKSGKRETSAEREKRMADENKKREIQEKYDKWGRGLKQVEESMSRAREMQEEGARPLARYHDDERMDAMLKERDREGDPMLAYIREKRMDDSQPVRPIYKDDFPPNRYNIRPGYRWDGVDRSNGYEKQYFEAKSKNKAQEEEAYKWSTEDL